MCPSDFSEMGQMILMTKNFDQKKIGNRKNWQKRNFEKKKFLKKNISRKKFQKKNYAGGSGTGFGGPAVAEAA